MLSWGAAAIALASKGLSPEVKGMQNITRRNSVGEYAYYMEKSLDKIFHPIYLAHFSYCARISVYIFP